jgi:hypothetical protein
VIAKASKAVVGDGYYADFWHQDWPRMMKADIVELEKLIYTTMIYAIPYLHDYIVKNFGLHMVYFMSNYLIKLDTAHYEFCKKVYDRVPPGVRVFGVHLRFHCAHGACGGGFYSYNVSNTMNVVRPFLQWIRAERPTVFAFGSDSADMEAAFRADFGQDMLVTDAVRKADYDHRSAMRDVLFLQMADECLLSFRSTFSFAIASRSGRTCWWVDKEAPDVIRLANSQSGSMSMLYTQWDVNDFQVARRFTLLPNGEEAMRHYFRYFIL